ncbi:MAG TPA: hypothetical protein VEO54_02840 [Thermoanaerobaculia bacterium]|nr:hypothetical protein [Thermoanaerobaculia bacterium]
MTAADIRVAFIPAEGDDLYTGMANEATLVFTNLTGDPIEVAPGTISFDVNFAALYLDAADQASIVIEATGWTAQFVSGMFDTWLLTPSAPAQWLDGTDLSFAVSALTPTVDDGTYSIGVTVNLGDSAPYHTLPVSVVIPSDDPDLRDTLHVTVDTDTVYGTKTDAQIIANTIEVTFLNTSPVEPIVPEDVDWGTTPPSFSISFPYASGWPGPFDLTTEVLAAQFEVSTTDPSWSVALLEGPPTWKLSPESHAILGPADGVTFTIGNIVTQLIAGATQMFVQWDNVPGYRDGHVSIPLYKEYRPVEIRQFAINQNTFAGLDVPQRAYLTWTVDNAVLVELSGYGQVAREEFQFAVPIEMSTSFVLTAYDPVTGTIATAAQAVTVEPSVLARAIPPGTILMWSGAEEDIPPGFVACDGREGTLDLSDRFIRGAGEGVPALESDTSSHTHVYPQVRIATEQSTEDGTHSHALPSDWTGKDMEEGNRYGIDAGVKPFETRIRDAGPHSHTISTTIDRPQGTTTENTPYLRPRWFALMYIMKRW